MSTYVMSDIHGQYETFIRMLNKIKFSDKDELYILGDIMDRGPENLKVLDYIMEHDNIHLLMGNHEDMLLNYYRTKRNHDLTLWLQNGGYSTKPEFDKISEEERIKYIEFLENLPLYKIINMNNKEYLLVHAGIHPDMDSQYLRDMVNADKKELIWLQDDILWIRHEFLLFKNNLPYTIIFGHTPIVNYPHYIRKMNDEMIDTIENSMITKWENKIGIDCGCAGALQLGCLRLDDMKEFYEKC